MTNQKSYKVTVSDVKAGGKLISVKDFAFMPLDNTLPEVVSVVSLGNKAVKVVMSEPIKEAKAANFKIDDKSFYGSITVTGNEAVLKPYDASTLAIGAHKLSISLVEDFAGLKSLTETVDFTVVEDKEGPSVSSVEATLEEAIITFNEDLDPTTVVAGDVYWMSGSVKKKAGSFDTLAGNKYSFDFTGNPLPAYETTLYIDSVSDYSGNVNATKEVKIHAVVDQTRPEVADVDFDASENNKVITVKFSKSVSAADKKYFTITDKDGKKVTIKDVKAVSGTSNKTFEVELYSALPAGANELKISGVRDNTTLENTMLDYTTTIGVGDTNPPQFSSLSANNDTRSIVIAFNEKMDPSTLADTSNYLINFNGVARQLPADTELTVVQDGKAVLIVLPEKIGNTDVTFDHTNSAGTAIAGSLDGITVLGVKDVAGNILSGYTTTMLPVATTVATTENYDATKYGNDDAVLTASKTIKVKFTQPIGKADEDDFTLTGTGAPSITNAVADGTNVVTLTLSDAITTDSGLTLAIVNGNDLETVVGNTVADGTVTVYDAVSPEVLLPGTATELDVTGNMIELPFSELLRDESTTPTANDDLYANDLIVTRLSDNTVLSAQTDYTTEVNGDTIEITILSSGVDSAYTVQVQDDAEYIRDLSGNFAVESEVIETDAVVDATGVAVSGVTNGATYSTVSPTFTGATATLQEGTNPATPYTSGAAINTTGSYKLTVTDSAGNATVVNFTIDATAPVLNSTFVFAANAAAAETITLSVDEDLDLEDGDAVTGLTIVDNAAAPITTFSAVYDADTDTIVITSNADNQLATDVVVTYTTTTGNVEDIYGNKAATTTITD